MASCEKCWADSYTMSRGSGKDRVEIYHELLTEEQCTLEEQAGQDAKICPECNQKTVHQIINECLNCGYLAQKEKL